MTNTQLLLSIGIPSLLIVLSWLANDKRFSLIESRMDRMESRLDGKTDRLEAKIDRFEAKLDHRFDDLTGKIISLHERVAVVEAKQA